MRLIRDRLIQSFGFAQDVTKKSGLHLIRPLGTFSHRKRKRSYQAKNLIVWLNPISDEINHNTRTLPCFGATYEPIAKQKISNINLIAIGFFF